MSDVFARLIRVLSSSRLALVLILLIVVFSLAGAMIPQEGMFGREDIGIWQQDHPLVTNLGRPLGLFHVFHSIPFLALVFLLAINTLTCTVIHIFRHGGLAFLRGPDFLRHLGFLLLHISLVVIFAGGFWSAGASMDGTILLTEGQTFQEKEANYLKLVKGPFFSENHRGFFLRLKKITTQYIDNRHLVSNVADLEVLHRGRAAEPGRVEVNRPFEYQGLNFTLDELGFSPRLLIRERQTGKILVNSFLALKTFRRGMEREYRDFIPLPIFEQRVIVTVLPSFTREQGRVVKTGEEPVKPLLIVEFEDNKGNITQSRETEMGGQVTLGDYTFTFAELRRWTTFRVVRDPGYGLVWLALWLGMVGFLLRYIKEMGSWFTPTKREDRS